MQFRHRLNEAEAEADPRRAAAGVPAVPALPAQKKGRVEPQGAGGGEARAAVLAGPATNMVRCLALNGGRETIAAKVGVLVVAAGGFSASPLSLGGGAVDSRIKADIDLELPNTLAATHLAQSG